MISNPIQWLNEDHLNTSRLLHGLREEVNAWKAGQSVDFERVADILDYLRNFPPLFHLPLETRVYEFLVRRSPGHAKALTEIAEQEKVIEGLLQTLPSALRYIRDNPRKLNKLFFETAEDLIDFWQHHIVTEEARFFPIATATLTAEEWNNIEREFAPARDRDSRDPSVRKYRSLFNDLVEAARRRNAGLFRRSPSQAPAAVRLQRADGIEAEIPGAASPGRATAPVLTTCLKEAHQRIDRLLVALREEVGMISSDPAGTHRRMARILDDLLVLALWSEDFVERYLARRLRTRDPSAASVFRRIAARQSLIGELIHDLVAVLYPRGNGTANPDAPLPLMIEDLVGLCRRQITAVQTELIPRCQSKFAPQDWAESERACHRFYKSIAPGRNPCRNQKLCGQPACVAEKAAIPSTGERLTTA